MCTLCDYFTTEKKTMTEHYVMQHGRHWEALVIRVTNTYPSLDNLCENVDTLVPRR